MLRLLTTAAATSLVLAGTAVAQDAPFAMQIKARQGIMDYRALQLGTLGAMAKGEAEYNAEVAQAAADNLVTAVTIDTSMLWPQGSDHDANPASTALAAIWADGSDIRDKGKAMVAAATALQAAAGTGVEAMAAAMGPVGEACGGCHKSFRVPQ